MLQLPNNKNLPELVEPPQSNPTKSLIALGLVLMIWVGLVAAFAFNQEKLSDWWRLRGYQPPATVQQLADQDTMTPYTQHLFYLNKPQLTSSVNTFRHYCPENKDTIVLGCYRPGQNGIYIYNVKDPALSGVVQVTAAHEVLHAIYARLSPKDRNYVDGLLNSYYKNGLTDQRVKDEVKIYQKTEPHDVTDEMNSIFGTEIADLPPALEAYYKKYFSDRMAIVAYEQRYDAEFSRRQSTISSDDRRLTAMKQQIDTQEAELQTEQSQLSAAQSQLKALLEAGQTDRYNAAVNSYNSRIDAYDNDVAGLKALINQYNQLVTVRNAVASELATLDKAIDTRLVPQTVH